MPSQADSPAGSQAIVPAALHPDRDAGAASPSEPARALARKTALPDELDLHPTEGLAKYLPMWLHAALFRLISMREIPRRVMGQPIIPNDAYFRRDRHRHPDVDPATFRLRVTGVRNPREFTLTDLEQLPREERVLVMECAGNGNHWMGSCGLVAQARWHGVALSTVLEACGGTGDATHFAFHGLDRVPLVRGGYHYGLSLTELARSRALLATHMNGEPLPRERGYPLRLVVPGIYSMSHVKWITHIEGKREAHRGFYNRYVFTNQARNGKRWEKVEARWIGLKSAITRCVRADDTWLLRGWAWGGDAEIERVDITTDGGHTWHTANIQRPSELAATETSDAQDRATAWTTFEFAWRPPSPGRYLVASRAFARGGREQPLEENPNVRGHFDQCRVKWRRVDVPG